MVRALVVSACITVGCSGGQRRAAPLPEEGIMELAAALETNHFAHPPAAEMAPKLREARSLWPLPAPIDRGTRVLSAGEAAALMRDVLEQDTTGLGLPELLSVDVDERTGEIHVVTPLPGSPAALAGVRPRDRLVEIDGEPTAGQTLSQAMSRLRGAPGTNVHLVIDRNGERRPLTLTREAHPVRDVVRARAHIESRPASPPVSVAYLRIPRIVETSPAEVEQSLLAIAENDLRAIVLDLRDNPGGDIAAAARVVGLFAGDVPVAELRGYRAPEAAMRGVGPQATTLPLVVLINEGTASAAEVIAGALQASGRAKVLGARSFGKGLVHLPVNLSNGSVLFVSIAKAITPHGRDLLEQGVEPDVKVPTAASPSSLQIDASPVVDPQFHAAIALLHPGI